MWATRTWTRVLVAAGAAAVASDGLGQPRSLVESADAMLAVGGSTPAPSAYWPRGGRVAVADVDGDKTPDIVVGMPECEVYGCDGVRAGKVVVYSGDTREVIRTLRGRVLLVGAIQEGFGALVQARDVDGDGLAEVFVAAERRTITDGPGAPIVSAGGIDVFSGATGGLLYTLSGSLAHEWLGMSFDVIGDIDGDSRPDLIVGSPGRRFNGSGGVERRCLSIYSGAIGVRLFEPDDPTSVSPGSLVCWSLAAVGDVNGDGKPEFATTSYNQGVTVLTAGTPPVWRRGVEFGNSQFPSNALTGPPFYVAGCGDLTGDSLDDFVCFGVGGEPPRVTRLAAYPGIVPPGSDWEDPLYSVDLPGVYKPLFLRAAGDVDGDGIIDLAIGCMLQSGGTIDSRVMILSGAGGHTIRSFVDAGWALSQSSVLWDGGGAADFNGDGAVDFALVRLRWTPEGALMTELAVFDSAPCAGDATGDSVVDFVDLNVVLSDYGRTAVAMPGDLNLDHRVDFLDLNDVLSGFGSACP